MITEGIIGFLLTGLEWIIRLLPSIDFPLNVTAALAEAASWIMWVNYYIPVDIFIGLLGAYFAVWVTCAIISVFLKLT